MRSFHQKLISCLLVLVLVLSVFPVSVFATSQTTVVSTEPQLLAAIEAIPEGGSGEITIENVYMALSNGIYFENKNIVFHLKNAQLVTGIDEYGYGIPVILALDSNVTINADDSSSMTTQGNTFGMGVVRVDNGFYDPDLGNYTKTCYLTVNGGRYSCVEDDFSFAVSAGTDATLTNVVCNGKVESILGVGLDFGGNICVNSGRFINDIREFAANGQFCCQAGYYYYVREREFSDEFNQLLTDGKLVFNYAKPSEDDESIWLIAEDFCMAHPDAFFGETMFFDDFTKCEIGIFLETAKEEIHAVDVVWNYDAAVLEKAQSFVEKFPSPDEERPWFDVTDLELVNYWVHHDPESEIDSLANYSGELKSYLGNSNFLFNIETRGGGFEPFYTESIGSGKLIHDGKVYFATTMLGARAEHAIYVPESTADTKQALMAAAQKRIDDYIGKDVVKITAADDTVSGYYNSELATFDARLASAQQELAAARDLLAAEQAKDPALWNWQLITDCNFTIMECQQAITYIPQYKQSFLASFEEGGDLHFLKKAAGDFFFVVEVKGETYRFVIIKDDAKQTVPSCATVDLDTKVSVQTDSSAVPLDTTVQVAKLTEGDAYDRIIDILDVKENVTFDIKLHSASRDQYITKLLDGTFEVSIPIPQELQNKPLAVYYVDENNTPTSYQVTVKDGFAIFATDHFSIYTLAESTGVVCEHTGGSATCCAKPICTVCKQAYGDLDPANHTGGTKLVDAKEATKTQAGYTGDTYCVGCGSKLASGKEIPASETLTSPQTGDSFDLALWTCLALLSFGCLLATALVSRKSEEK